jgi:hypothetical protein
MIIRHFTPISKIKKKHKHCSFFLQFQNIQMKSIAATKIVCFCILFKHKNPNLNPHLLLINNNLRKDESVILFLNWMGKKTQIKNLTTKNPIRKSKPRIFLMNSIPALSNKENKNFNKSSIQIEQKNNSNDRKDPKKNENNQIRPI